MLPMSKSIVEVLEALCKEGNNAAHEDHDLMHARLLVQELVREFRESEKKVRVRQFSLHWQVGIWNAEDCHCPQRSVMRAMLKPGRLVLKDEDQLKAAQELSRQKVPDTVPFEACVDCVRHFMTMECLEVSRILISLYKNGVTERDSRLTPSRTNL